MLHRLEATQVDQNNSGLVVVVALDNSGADDAVLAYALSVAAGDGGATVHVVNALGKPDPMQRMHYAIETHQLDLDAERRALAARVAALSAGASVNTEVHVVAGPPAEEILRLAATLDADLVIVGTHGRKGLGRVVLGSVAEAVLRGAACAVLVVRDKSWGQ